MRGREGERNSILEPLSLYIYLCICNMYVYGVAWQAVVTATSALLLVGEGADSVLEPLKVHTL